MPRILQNTPLTITALLAVLAAAPAVHAAGDASMALSLQESESPLGEELSTDPTPMSCTVQPADANDDSASTTKNTSVTIDVFSNDSGLGIGGIGDPEHGTAEEGFNNTIIYTPDTGFTGTDSFVYSVRGCLQCFDGWCSEPDFDPATVTVTVTH